MRYVGKGVVMTAGDFAYFNMWSHIVVGLVTMCGRLVPAYARRFASARFVCPQCVTKHH